MVDFPKFDWDCIGREANLSTTTSRSSESTTPFSIEIVPRLVSRFWPIVALMYVLTSFNTENDRSHLALLTGKVRAKCSKFQSVLKPCFRGFSLSKALDMDLASCSVLWATRTSAWRFSLWHVKWPKWAKTREILIFEGRSIFGGSESLVWGA